jgi:phosphate starvation-inducible PhoH-like protein
MSRNKQAKPQKNSRRNGYDTEQFDVPMRKPNRIHTEDKELFVPEEYQPIVDKVIPPLRALTEAQGQYIAAQRTDEIVFGVGCAGTGKTYVALALACEQLLNKEIESIIVVRPLVETGRALGAMPGTLEEKISPYFLPVIATLEERLGKSKFHYYLKRGQIKFLPLELLRGSTFNDATVVLDEAQNTTTEQVKMFLTRMGKNCRLVLNGDDFQQDLRGTSGLVDAIRRLEHLDGIRVVRFEPSDIVRNPLIKSILIAYRGV